MDQGQQQLQPQPLSYRMPAEWEPQEAVWLQWPAEEMRPYSGYHLKKAAPSTASPSSNPRARFACGGPRRHSTLVYEVEPLR